MTANTIEEIARLLYETGNRWLAERRRSAAVGDWELLHDDLKKKYRAMATAALKRLGH